MIDDSRIPLGILNDNEFNSEIENFDVESGDKIYLYNDGIKKSDGEIFENNRLENILISTSDNRFEAILNKLEIFTGS